MTKAQLAYNKRIAKKIQVIKEDLAFSEGMVAEWEEWISKNEDKDFNSGTAPMAITMPFWMSDKWKHRAERGIKLQTVAKEMVADAKKHLAKNREWIAMAENFLSEQVAVVEVAG